MKLVVNNKKSQERSFIYVYKNWTYHGKGDMLCSIYNGKCDYVLFKPITGEKTVVIDEKLLELFKEGIN